MRKLNPFEEKMIVVGLVALAGYWAWKKAATTVADNIDLVNPVSPDNLAYQGVNKVVQAATGDTDATLGTKIYDWTHPFGLSVSPYLPFTIIDLLNKT